MRGGIFIKFSNLKTAVKVLLIVAIGCYFLNFASVSFWGISSGGSGFEFATTISLHEELEFDEEDTPNLYLIAGALCALLGLGIIWESQEGDKKALISGGFAVAGAIALFLFRATFADLNQMAGYEQLLSLKFGSGWMLSLLAYIGAAGTALTAYNMGLQDKRALFSQSGTHPNATPSNPPLGCKAPIGSDDVPEPAVYVEAAPIPEQSEPKVVIRSRSGTGMLQEWCPAEFPCLIGRDASITQIIIPDISISKVHAKLYIEANAVMIADENSSNGTFVNEIRITSPVEILSGDIVTIGETRLFFEVRGE